MQPLHILRRVAHAPLTLLGICTLVFVLIRALPGDTIAYYRGQLGPDVDARTLDEMRRARGLDRNIGIQYLYWLRDAARGDLGHSYTDRRPVTEKIAERLPNTLLLNATALTVSTLIALPIGLFLGSRRRRLLALASDLLLLLLFSLPTFWVALLLMEWLAVKLGVVPLYGMESDPSAGLLDRAAHMILPVICLSLPQVAIIARFTRTALETTMGEDHIRAARARGIDELQIVLRHGFRNILIPLVSLLGVMLPYLLSGSVIVERIFQWYGAGELFFDAVMARDYPVVMGVTLATAVLVLAVTTLTDLLYSVSDPRIREGGEA